MPFMDDLQARAIRLIEPLIPPDAQDRVERTIKQFNNVVREHIRTETGLRLADSQSTGTIPIRVVAGFPAKLAELIDRHQDRVLWRLIIGQPKLGGIVEGLNFLLPDWPEFERWLNLPSVAIGSEPALMRTRDVAVALQGLAVTKKVLDELKEIHEDILGVYRFATRVGGSIEIYWMATALVAGALGVRVEDLAVVALAHELAHGYTHQGRDIDGLSWADDGFARSALEVKEGLAQFYTAVVAERLGSRAPGVFAAYAKLLELQTGPYLVHTQWLDGTRRQRGETVRFVVLQARNYGVVTHEKWRGLLTETSQRLKPGGAAPGSG
jgi:hypothetical protein